MSEKSPITLVLESIEAGETKAADELFPAVYQELLLMARSRMLQERAGHTLQPTALVHEAFLRLTEGNEVPWANRRYFFASAAEAMRRILIDYARSKNRQKRGGDMVRVTLEDDIAVFSDDGSELIAVSAALDQLEDRDAAMAEIVKLRYFAGLTVEETAQATNLSARSVNRQWNAARAWLRMALDENAVDGASA